MIRSGHEEPSIDIGIYAYDPVGAFMDKAYESYPVGQINFRADEIVPLVTLAESPNHVREVGAETELFMRDGTASSGLLYGDRAFLLFQYWETKRMQRRQARRVVDKVCKVFAIKSDIAEKCDVSIEANIFKDFYICRVSLFDRQYLVRNDPTSSTVWGVRIRGNLFLPYFVPLRDITGNVSLVPLVSIEINPKLI